MSFLNPGSIAQYVSLVVEHFQSGIGLICSIKNCLIQVFFFTPKYQATEFLYCSKFQQSNRKRFSSIAVIKSVTTVVKLKVTNPSKNCLLVVKFQSSAILLVLKDSRTVLKQLCKLQANVATFALQRHELNKDVKMHRTFVFFFSVAHF